MEFKLNTIEKEIIIEHRTGRLMGILAIPINAKAIIIFAHGSGSGRFSPRNNFVARFLQEAHLGTLLLDLLSEEEALNRQNVFDIHLLAERLNIAKIGLLQDQKASILPIGFFGASTGAGAAIQAVALDPKNIFALVSRGGRPDLASEALEQINVPTLLIVGGNDEVVLDLNQGAFTKMHCPKEMVIVPGATHLFEEPGTLLQVADLAKNWFIRYASVNHKS